MERKEIYRSDSEVLGGTPVFTGTRVPVQSLLDHLEGGDTVEDFIAGFPTVRKEQAIAFLELAKDAVLKSG